MQAYERLEQEWAAFNGLDPAGMVACSSGTAALHLTFEAFRLPAGSEVLVPDYTMVACPRAVALAGLTPVFVDCGDDLLVKPGLLTTHVLFVHVYGRRVRIGEFGLDPGGYVVEDLAEAHGVRPHEETDAACWSFYKNKIVAGEEGGAVWFRNAEHAAFARQLRSLGFTDAHDYDHVPRGCNYRLANALAELIRMDLSGKRAEWQGFRRKIEAWYDAACPPEWRQPDRDAVWVYDVRVPGWTRDRVLAAVRALRAAGVEARPGFLPMSAQQEFWKCRGTGNENAERASNEVLYLPVQPGTTTPGLVDRAFAVLREQAQA